MLQAYPQSDRSQIIDNAATDIEWVKNFIVAIGNIRAEMGIAPTKPLPLLLRNLSTEASRRLEQNQPQLLNLAKLDSITVLSTADTLPACAAQQLGSMDLFVAKAPEAVLAKKREKLADAEAAIVKLLAQQAEIAAI